MKHYSDINWQKCLKEVSKLQEKIIVAYNKKDLTRVYELQEILVNKFEARALAVRKVTSNPGKNTPGVDKKLISTDEEKIGLIDQLKNLKNYKASPVRRVLIPKANGKMRPLGIPTIFDRSVQALYHFALDPIAELKADSRSYGFRKNRSTQDVQQYVRGALNKKDAARFILDADIKGFFDNISHDWILKHIPMNKYILKEWLKAGFLSNNALFDSLTGVPQGGIISPTLANMVLDGLENLIEDISKAIKKKQSAANRKLKISPYYNPKIHFIRYADDFLVTAGKLEYFDILKPAIEKFLLERGVKLNQEKTKIYKIENGFDFVGFNFRKYPSTRRASKEILLAFPTKKSILRLKLNIRKIFKKYKYPIPLISALNPVLRGWANYYRYVNASRIFYSLDHYVFQKTLKWIRSRKRGRGLKTAIKEFFKKEGNNNWNFQYTDPKIGKTFRIFQLGSVKISNYILVKNLNPYLKENQEYYRKRSEIEWTKTISNFLIKLIKKQKGICPVCKKTLIFNNEENLEVHHIQPREFLGNQKIKNLLLLHKTCHQSVTNCKDPYLLAKYVTEGIIKPLSKRYQKLLDKKNSK